LEIVWTEAAFDNHLDAVGVDGDRLVAVGKDDGAIAAWTSTDGMDWETVAVPPPDGVVEDSDGLPPDFEATASRMGRLVRLDETLFSFGIFNFMDFVRPVGWRWTDDGEWEYIDSSSAFYASGSVTDVVATEDGLMAARQELALSWSGADATMWAWTPETSWRQVDLSQADPARVWVNEVAWDGAGYLASGLIPIPGDMEPDSAAVGLWQSTDGRAWAALEPPAGAVEICSLEAMPAGGFAAMGYGTNGIAVWRFSAGRWSEMSLSDEAIEGPDASGPTHPRCTIVPLDAGTLAFFQDDAGVRVWASRDGISWEPGGVVARNAVHIAGGGDRVVLVTAAGSDMESNVTIRVGRVGP
jgi:hypothetical protein